MHLKVLEKTEETDFPFAAINETFGTTSSKRRHRWSPLFSLSWLFSKIGKGFMSANEGRDR